MKERKINRKIGSSNNRHESSVEIASYTYAHIRGPVVGGGQQISDSFSHGSDDSGRHFVFFPFFFATIHFDPSSLSDIFDSVRFDSFDLFSNFFDLCYRFMKNQSFD